MWWRLALARLLGIDTWQVVLERFRARTCDPKLVREPWMAEALLQAAAERWETASAPAGFLDEETAWRTVLGALLGLDDPRPDAERLLRWSLEPGRLGAWSGLAPEVREGLARYLEAMAGLAGREILGCLRADLGGDAVAIGVVCGVLFASDAPESTALLQARVRMEPWIGGRTVQEAAGRRWASASAAVLRPLASEERRRIHLRAEVLLQELRAEGLAVLSDDLPASWEARLRTWAEHLGEVGRAPSRPALDRAEGVWQALVRHRSWQDGEEGRSRLAMARRLGWALLEAPLPAEAAPVSLVEAAGGYAATLAWMDRAREELVAGVGELGEAAPVLESAFDALWQRVTERREAFNQRFGRLLSQWIEAGSGTQGPLLGVEALLGEVVAPIARRMPVLLLVLDGMSVPIYLALREDVAGTGWVEVMPAEAGAGGGAVDPVRHQAVAMLPTVTEVSRASLLCGTPRRGTARDEKEGFEGHPALLAVSRGDRRPLLFHKAELGGGQVGIAEEVRQAVQDVDRQVVAVVINAIDDHLAKGDQIATPQALDAILPLGPLLGAARAAGRCVILTSDHGHVFERGLAYRRSETDHARYRRPGAPLAEDEVLLRGPRVLSGTDEVVAPWSERVRYGPKKAGYHGGASPQEVLVPIGIFLPNDRLGRLGEGWVEASLRAPSWWWPDVEMMPAPAALRPAAEQRPDQPGRLDRPTLASRKGAQGELFRAPVGPVAAEGPARTTDRSAGSEGPASPAAPDWIAGLLAAPPFVERRRQYARFAIPDERIRDVLAALERQGGTLRIAALALQLNVSLVRLRSILGALRTLLNVDAYPVLTLDEVSESVRLDRALLEKQFELGGPERRGRRP